MHSRSPMVSLLVRLAIAFLTALAVLVAGGSAASAHADTRAVWGDHLLGESRTYHYDLGFKPSFDAVDGHGPSARHVWLLDGATGTSLVSSGELSAPRTPGVKPGGGSPLHSPDFVVHPNGEIVAVPKGAVGPTPARTGSGFQFRGGSGGHGLDPRVTDVRIMDPVLGGKHPLPNGYVSYGNASGQTVNPWTGRTIDPSSPWWHWGWSSR